MPYWSIRFQIASRSITAAGSTAGQNHRSKSVAHGTSCRVAGGPESSSVRIPTDAAPETSHPIHPLGHCPVTTTFTKYVVRMRR